MNEWSYFVNREDIIPPSHIYVDPEYLYMVETYRDLHFNHGFFIGSAVEMMMNMRSLLDHRVLTDLTALYALREVFPDLWSRAIEMGHVLRLRNH